MGVAVSTTLAVVGWDAGAALGATDALGATAPISVGATAVMGLGAAGAMGAGATDRLGAGATDTLGAGATDALGAGATDALGGAMDAMRLGATGIVGLANSAAPLAASRAGRGREEGARLLGRGGRLEPAGLGIWKRGASDFPVSRCTSGAGALMLGAGGAPLA